eukprot:TRINITY_DN2592_c0_g1_i1.p1 TRINITY_DN2592_c0_g1~~TRINITY_DN2592_c0_g1_i1.p1  ORF type:complete len:182 (-),score=48.09 TRINITY_DN2592_c0_g1_i1:355-900(-)
MNSNVGSMQNSFGNGSASVTPYTEGQTPMSTAIGTNPIEEDAIDVNLLQERERLENFIDHLDEYTPTIPDEVVSYYLTRAGFQSTDKRILRLVSLATQKFVSTIAEDAFQHQQMRAQAAGKDKTKGGSKDRRVVLTSEDLSLSLKGSGINVQKPAYLADRLLSGLEQAPTAPAKRQKSAKD